MLSQLAVQMSVKLKKNMALPTDPTLLANPKRPFIHRDISWIQFNGRVLQEARDKANPLLERLKFLAITASNLDEFFMIRVSAAKRSLDRALRTNATNLKSRKRVHQAILARAASFNRKQTVVFETLRKDLEQEKIHIVRQPKPTTEAFEVGRLLFSNDIATKLFDIEELTFKQLKLLDNLQMAALLSNNNWLPIPTTIDDVYVVQREKRKGVYVFFLDDLIMTHLPSVLGDKGGKTIVRITRDADFKIEIDGDDAGMIPDMVRSGISRRSHGRPMRLQWIGKSNPDAIGKLGTTFQLPPENFFHITSSLNLKGLWKAIRLLKTQSGLGKHLVYPPNKPHIPSSFRSGRSVFSRLKEGDIILHHPYDGFDAFVEWIRSSCKDPKVETIQLTVYRVDAASTMIEALKKAAKNKKIQVMIEVRARFDELNNLNLANELRAAGVEVKFGFGKLKLHAKVALVRRVEQGEPMLYTHLSTGNYNATTASLYEDIGIITANQKLGNDAAHFFDSVWREHVPSTFTHLTSAPIKLHKRLISLIDREIASTKDGAKGHILVKVNTLVDEHVTEKLYEASQAGVRVDLIVRGACTLIPGIKGLSENIQVISLVDRYLEHSRIYLFKNSKALYLSSADWMPRNFFSRLEIAFPVLDKNIYDFIENVVLPTYLMDGSRAKELSATGKWRARPKNHIERDRKHFKPLPYATPDLRTQFYFETLSRKKYRGTSLFRRLGI